MKKRYLILQNGTVFEGCGFGADAVGMGELVFTTGMCGYIETLTDPSYYGQIIMHTFPMIGNYGIIEEDFESICHAKGYVVREWCENPSNFRCEYNIDKFLKDVGVPGICGVDTRYLTKLIRENGVMNAMICDEVPEDLSALAEYKIVDAAANVTCEKAAVYPASGEEKYKVTIVDYGVVKSIITALQRRSCTVTVVPAGTSAEEILAADPDGILLSGGPGDPTEYTEYIAQVKALLGKKPVFGIGLGHQLMALATGANTRKLKYGHRGANQPVKDTAGTRTFITSQNHGYTVKSESVKAGRVSFINANDCACEGIDYADLKAFSVQFMPETGFDPMDTSYLYDKFTAMMGGTL